MLGQLVPVFAAAALSGLISAIATIAALKAELRALRRDVDRHELDIRELRPRAARS